MSRSGPLLVALLALLACRADPVSPGTPAVPTASGPPVPPPPPAPMSVRSAVAREPEGPAPLSDRDENVIDPASTFRVEIEGRLLDVRLVLLDERDALVPSASAREVGPVTRLDLVPSAPLVPGSCYVLRLEGVAATRPVDGAGRTLSPASFPLVAAGDPPPPPPRRRRR